MGAAAGDSERIEGNEANERLAKAINTRGVHCPCRQIGPRPKGANPDLPWEYLGRGPLRPIYRDPPFKWAQPITERLNHYELILAACTYCGFTTGFVADVLEGSSSASA
jgi:hypothetical protein